MIRSNANDIKRKIKASLKAKDRELRKATDQFLTDVVRDAKINVARNKSVATGELINSISRTKNSAGTTADYAPYVEFGTKTKRKVPNDPQVAQIANYYKSTGDFDDMIRRLEDWGKNKGILDKRTIFKIARSIAKKGSSAKPFFYPAVFKNKVKLRKNLKKALKKRV